MGGFRNGSIVAFLVLACAAPAQARIINAEAVLPPGQRARPRSRARA